jgi:alcohol dehydrogenase
MSHTFVTTGKIITGCKSLDEVGKECAAIGRRCVLVTAAASMRRTGVTDRVVALLKKEGVVTAVFDGVKGEPTVTDVDAGRRICRDQKCDMVVALGGGSAIDAAKVIAGLAFEQEPTEVFHGGKAIPGRGLPFVAIPTTAGTGSEVTPNSVITNPRTVEKKSIRSSLFISRVAIVDPELTLTVPPTVTAHTGMDALTQAIESYISIHATPITEALSLESARLIGRSLLPVYRDGSNLAARTDMAYGSLMAGMALANARLGVVHGIAHPLGVRYHIPHGLVCAVLLPRAMRFSAEAAREKFARLSHLLGRDIFAFVQEAAAEFGLPRTLRDYKLQASDFPAIVKESMSSGSLKANPQKVTERDVEEMLREVAG